MNFFASIIIYLFLLCSVYISAMEIQGQPIIKGNIYIDPIESHVCYGSQIYHDFLNQTIENITATDKDGKNSQRIFSLSGISIPLIPVTIWIKEITKDKKVLSVNWTHEEPPCVTALKKTNIITEPQLFPGHIPVTWLFSRKTNDYLFVNVYGLCAQLKCSKTIYNRAYDQSFQKEFNKLIRYISQRSPSYMFYDFSEKAFFLKWCKQIEFVEAAFINQGLLKPKEKNNKKYQCGNKKFIIEPKNFVTSECYSTVIGFLISLKQQRMQATSSSEEAE